MKQNEHHKLRTFIAVPVPRDVILFLDKIQGEIKKKLIKASWSRIENTHLTLRFIGDTDPEEISKIIAAIKKSAAATPEFRLGAGSVGVFPTVKRARVIWAGVKGEIEVLTSLHMTLNRYLNAAGFKNDDKRFLPHFTLGRFKQRIDCRMLVEIIKEFQYDISETFLCRSLHLYESELRPSGAVHTSLFEAPLSNQHEGL